MNSVRVLIVVKRVGDVLDSLSFWYNVILVALFVWGVYALFANESPNAVYSQGSPTAYDWWLAWHIVAPPVLWVGQWLKRWWIRWAGDAVLFTLAATWAIALHQQDPAESLIPALFMLIAFGLATRDLIKALGRSRGCD